MMFLQWLQQAASFFVKIGTPIVLVYHLLLGNIFLNVAAEDAQGLESIANVVLTPVQYLLAGKKAIPDQEGYNLEQRFEYRDHFILKSTCCLVALPLSITVGSTLKTLAFLDPMTRKRHEEIERSLLSKKVTPHDELYRQFDLEMEDFVAASMVEPPQYKRRPGEENCLQEDKEALKEIVRVLNDHHIPFWVDCGTCLGTYRYGGAIPWDWDIDLAILQIDHDNVKNALKNLDPSRFVVQDWSSRLLPKTYLKVYVKKTASLIDIYHFAIDKERKTIHTVLSNENSLFLPESWKIRERRYTKPIPFSVVFPLKKALFDGIEVAVPRQTKAYLQVMYGENIDPAKVYNEVTGNYENDPTHPYWQQAHAR